MVTYRGFRKDALEFANVVRKRLGLPPVDHLYPGVKRNGWACAITETIYHDDLDRAAFVVHTDDYFGATITTNLQYIQIPPTLGSRGFIRNFDQGRYPELVKKTEHKENTIEI